MSLGYLGARPQPNRSPKGRSGVAEECFFLDKLLLIVTREQGDVTGLMRRVGSGFHGHRDRKAQGPTPASARAGRPMPSLRVSPAFRAGQRKQGTLDKTAEPLRNGRP